MAVAARNERTVDQITQIAQTIGQSVLMYPRQLGLVVHPGAVQ